MYRFLELSEVLELHAESLRVYGGSAGTRDAGLVESALTSAVNTASYTDADVFEIAAVYAFHLAEAQGFIDGNKRTAIGTALVFLALNQAMVIPDAGDLDTLYNAMIAIARHELDRPGLAALFRELFA